MPNVSLSPVFNGQVSKDNGDPASGWKIATYLAGSTTPHPTYTDSSGTVAHTNPIIIDALGFPTMGEIWLEDSVEYKFVLTDANDVVKRTVDDISGVNDTTSLSISQWIPSGQTPTYVSASSFSLVGDQTTEFHVGRRVQAKQGVSLVYGTITSTTFASGLTTVALQMDAPGVLNAGLSEVNLSLLRADHHALPKVALDLVSLNVDTSINAPTGNFTTLNVAGAVNQAPQVTLPSAATVGLGAAASNSILITGTTTIDSFGIAPAGITRTVEFQSALTLTYNATSMQLPGLANITTQSGDVMVVYSKGAGNWKVISYSRFAQAPSFSSIPTIQLFTTSGNFTVPPGVSRVRVTVVGGGSSGGFFDGGESGTPSYLIGGSGGGTAIKVISGLTAGQVIPVTVGAGGVPSPGTGIGGTSSFGAFCSATGGGATGGNGVGGDINLPGGVGQTVPINQGVGSSMAGGSALSAASRAAAIYGGASGSSSAGAQGVVIVEY